MYIRNPIGQWKDCGCSNGVCKSQSSWANNPLFNLHPWKWFEGYPVKSTPFFSGWQKHLRFSRVTTWEKAGFHKVNQKKNGCHALENLRCFCHPEKNRVDFTGYHSNHFSGCRLNGWLLAKMYTTPPTPQVPNKGACSFIRYLRLLNLNQAWKFQKDETQLYLKVQRHWKW